MPEVLRLLLAPLPPTRSPVLSGSEHCSVFRTICSKHSGPECGDLGSGGGSEPALPHSSFTGIPCGPFPLVQGRPSPAALPQVWILGIPGHLRLPLRAQPPPRGARITTLSSFSRALCPRCHPSPSAGTVGTRGPRCRLSPASPHAATASDGPPWGPCATTPAAVPP